MKDFGFFMTGTDNDGFRHRYSVKKNENFERTFLRFMEELGFDRKKDYVSDVFLTQVHDEYENELTIKRNISDITDEIRYYNNKKFEVDVFFGSKKVIILIRSKQRVDFINFLINQTDWISEKEAKEIREKRNEKYIIKAGLKKVEIKKKK